MNDSARRVERNTGARAHTRTHRYIYIYSSVSFLAYNCGRHAVTRVLNALCKVTVFQPAATPDDVIVSGLPRLVSVYRNDGCARCRRDIWLTSVTNSLDTLRAREILGGRYLRQDPRVLLRVIISSRRELAIVYGRYVARVRILVAARRFTPLASRIEISAKRARTESYRFTSDTDAERLPITVVHPYSYSFYLGILSQTGNHRRMSRHSIAELFSTSNDVHRITSEA